MPLYRRSENFFALEAGNCQPATHFINALPPLVAINGVGQLTQKIAESWQCNCYNA